MPLLHSCIDDDHSPLHNDNAYSLLAMGTIRIIEGNDYYFDLDDGTQMYPGDTAYIKNYTPIERQRAFIYYNLLSKKVNGYDYNAQVIHIQNIETKDIYVMPTAKADSIGDDRINITNMWFANHHLNIEYQIMQGQDSSVKHLQSLIVNPDNDNKNDKTDYITLEFRHNAHNDASQVQGTGFLSFRLDSIASLMEGKKGLNIRTRTIYDYIRYTTIEFK